MADLPCPPSPHARSIQIYLPFGEPRGLRIAEITTRIISCAAFPRANFEQAATRQELHRTGLYFLFGGNLLTRQSLYIGEAEDCINRLRRQDATQQDEFWNTALVFVSRTGHFTKTHARYLEWASVDRALRAGRYDLLNTQINIRPYVTEPLVAELSEVLETIETLAGVFGHAPFEPLAPSNLTANSPDLPTASIEPVSKTAPTIFECSVKGILARAIYTEDGLVVLQGSQARIDEVPSLLETYRSLRSDLISDGTLKQENDQLIFARNHPFPSPSAAGAVVTGSTVNGWITWKTSTGRTLDELIRGN